MSLFNLPNSSLLISGGTFVNEPYTRTNLEVITNTLGERFVSSATHDTSDILDPPKCHPGTRVALLQRLSDWVKDPNSDTHLSWLHGPAGAGKSAIARSLAELLEKDGYLAGSFFFFRADAKRNSEKSLVATLAYQLARYHPIIQPHLATCLTEDPMILTRSLQTQFEKLIVDPVIRMTAENQQALPKRPMLILIDGLDESGEHRRRYLVLQTILAMLSRLHGHLKFLIVSRPEHDIHAVFETTTTIFSNVELLADLHAYDDVRIFLLDSFNNIKLTHPLQSSIRPDWPTHDSIEKLVEKSSGHFIYASTVIKYIENAYSRPQKCLEDILNLRKTLQSPYAELDALYLNILRTSRVDRTLLVDVLSAALISGQIFNPYFNTLAGMRFPDSMTKSDRFVESVIIAEPGDVQLALLDLKSLTRLHRAKNESLNISTIEFLHKSFSDFLYDASRSAEFYVHERLASTMVAKGCLLLLADKLCLMERYWQCRSIQGSEWDPRPVYHDCLSTCCENAFPDPKFQMGMMTYDLIDLLLPKQIMDGAITHRRVIVFPFLCEYLSSFQSSPAFKNTDIYIKILRQFDEYMKSELRYWVAHNSKILIALKESIFPNRIDGERFEESDALPEFSTLTDAMASCWPYFLYWLSSRMGGTYEVTDRFVCGFFHTKERAGEYYLGN